MNLARLLFPAIRWDAATGFRGEGARIDEALDIGVGGFILFGGVAADVHEFTMDLQARSRYPLLIAADLERGAGQQFAGATPLPPLAALGSIDDAAISRRAGELTAREARALGVNWVLAPVADVDLEPDNPIVGTRSFGTDENRVARHVDAWIRGCHDGGALACAKHFPGHGRTTADSHAELPRVDATAQELAADLAPFRAAVRAGTDAMMTAHVAFPALEPDPAPATLSRTILDGIGRTTLGFDGIFVTDALNMAGLLEGAHDEGAAAVRALAAGCDALLYPQHVSAVLNALETTAGEVLPRDRVAQALNRIDSAARRAANGNGRTGSFGAATDLRWAIDTAISTVHVVRGAPRLPGHSVQILTIDDDLGGPFPPPSRDRFIDALRALGAEIRPVTEPDPADPLIVAVYCDIRAWKGRPGLSDRTRAGVRAVTRDDSITLLFGHPRLAADLPGEHVAAAWGGEWLMQEAAAQWLIRRPRE